jgi:hypothetical protein
MTIEAEIRKIVREAAKRKDTAYLAAELKKLLNDPKWASQFTEELLTDVRAKYEYLTLRTASQEDRRIADEIIQRSGGQFAQTVDGINRTLLKKVSDAMKADKTAMEIENIAESIVGRQRFVAKTITETALGAFDRIGTINDGIKVDGKDVKFTYFGPPAQRYFCVNLLAMAKQGKTWTLAEIKAMSNGQGLPVLYYCGGFRCKHSWLKV